MNKCLYCYKKLERGNTTEFHELCSMEFFGTKAPPALPYSFKQMTELAKDVVDRSVAVPGVQPKLSLSLVQNTLADGKKGGLTVAGALGGNYILKPPSENYSEMPQNEHVTMRIAEASGLKTVKSSLIRLQSGELAYITKRIDRMDTGEKIHMLDMFQITEAVDKYKSSIEKIGKTIDQYSDETLLDQLFFFELTLFSFITGNNDMHLKNFSMINTTNKWTLAPAYDLLNVTIANPEDDEELAITLEGKKKKLKREHFIRLAQRLGLNNKQIEGVFYRLRESRIKTVEWIRSSFLSPQAQRQYLMLMLERILILRR